MEQFGLGGLIERSWNRHAMIAMPKTDADQAAWDRYWMQRALLAAMNGVGWSSPNPSVGAVLVYRNQCLREGFTQAYRLEHAEKMALHDIEKAYHPDVLKQSTLFVTLEPCAHQGHQPACVDRVLALGIGRVVVGVQDPDSRVQGRSFERLKTAGVKLDVGVCARECALWHFPFIESKKHSKQIWIGKWAQNQDGYLCDAEGQSKWISSPKSRSYSHWLRQKYDVILVGAGTWLKDAPQLTVRDCALPHRRNPIRVVFDPSKRIPQTEGVLIPKVGRSFEDLKKWFSDYDFEKQFGRPVQTIFVEGGPALLNGLLTSQSLDALHVFTAEKKFEQVNERHRIGANMHSADLLKPYTKVHEQFIAQDFLQEFALLH